MFLAREAGLELIGTIGSRSTVVNNDQIVESVSAGVYRAVREAISFGSSSTSATSTAVINLDGAELGHVLLPHLRREETRITPNLQIAAVRG